MKINFQFSVTPSYDKVQQFSLSEVSLEYFNKQEVKHDPLTQHPGEHSSE